MTNFKDWKEFYQACRHLEASSSRHCRIVTRMKSTSSTNSIDSMLIRVTDDVTCLTFKASFKDCVDINSICLDNDIEDKRLWSLQDWQDLQALIFKSKPKELAA
jgi:hypothetical protein